jgi:DNA-binding NarL/FixJ family response regulator
MNANFCTGQCILQIQEVPVTSYVNKAATSLLIVDDSPLIVKNLMELLESIAAITSIVSCGTYTKAIDLLPIHNPIAVLLDINLPDKSGINLLKYIKTSYPEITVIIVTNQSDEFYKLLCLELGARYFLDKSNDFEKIPALIASII